MAGEAFSLTAHYKFEEVPQGMPVTQTSKEKGTGFFRVMIPIAEVVMRKLNWQAVQNELNQLKRFY
ncbi:MAG: hypothetical protein CMM01_17875 [Rhodopirellula sp.]|nr:hypothetical protein [Rhodopirellula sp.]